MFTAYDSDLHWLDVSPDSLVREGLHTVLPPLPESLVVVYLQGDYQRERFRPPLVKRGTERSVPPVLLPCCNYTERLDLTPVGPSLPLPPPTRRVPVRLLKDVDLFERYEVD